MDERLAVIERKLDELLAALAKWQPVLERYAGNAGVARWAKRRENGRHSG